MSSKCIVRLPTIAEQQQRAPKEDSPTVPAVKTNKVDMTTSVVQSGIIKRQTQLQQRIDTAIKAAAEKKRAKVAADKTLQERKDKERGDYQRFFYMIGKHSIKHKQYEHHPASNRS